MSEVADEIATWVLDLEQSGIAAGVLAQVVSRLSAERGKPSESATQVKAESPEVAAAPTEPDVITIRVPAGASQELRSALSDVSSMTGDAEVAAALLEAVREHEDRNSNRRRLVHGSYLSYVLPHEGYPSPFSARLTGLDVLPQVVVRAAGPGGGYRWEFRVISESPIPNADVSMGTHVPKLRMEPRSWQAFAEIPDFFAALANLGPRPGLFEVRRVLDEIGATDDTYRDLDGALFDRDIDAL